MNNLIIEILNKITASNLCFQYDGACSTCGMMDVKHYLKKYSIDEIVDGYKDLDFENKEVQEYIIGLEKLFSLMTGPHTVWNDRNKIKELTEFLKLEQNDNPYIKRLLESHSETYWNKWELKYNEHVAKQEEQERKAQERRQYISTLKENDKKDRENDLRDKLISALNEMTNYEKLVHMSNDSRHTPKFYPGNIAYHTTQEDIDMLDNDQYKNLCKMFNMRIKGSTAWGKFKKRFLNLR